MPELLFISGLVEKAYCLCGIELVQVKFVVESTTASRNRYRVLEIPRNWIAA